MDIWGIWIEYLWNMRCDRFLDLMDRCGIVHDHYVTYEHLFVIVSGDKYYIYIFIYGLWVMGMYMRVEQVTRDCIDNCIVFIYHILVCIHRFDGM
jgi:hypothetical protein